MGTHPVLCLLLVVGLLGAACGSTDDAPTGAESTGTYPVGRVEDLTWTTPDVEPEVVGVHVQATTGEEWPMALAYPDTDRPPSGWPVVVSFHGATTGTPFNRLDELASRGAVVVAPRWAPPQWSTTNLSALSAAEYADGYWFDVAACALAAAQEAAVGYSGDPSRTTVVGFSGGVHPAARTALGTARNDLCPDREPAVRPAAMVAGDSQWIFQGETWDETFDDPTSLATDTVDRILNPDRWVDLPPTFQVYLWSTESTAWMRDVDNPPADDSWLISRLPDGTTLVDDLSAVGAFDDGRIMFGDNALLLEKRLRDEGITVLHEVFPTNHLYAPGVYDRIIELVFEAKFS